MGIDRDGWHSHTCSHDRDTMTLVGTCVAEHIANFVEANGIFKEVFSDKFSTKRITRKQNLISDFALFCGNMDRHVMYLFVLFSNAYNSAKIAFTKPLKLPLICSVTSTTSSWLSSDWKPAAKFVIAEIPKTFMPE